MACLFIGPAARPRRVADGPAPPRMTEVQRLDEASAFTGRPGRGLLPQHPAPGVLRLGSPSQRRFSADDLLAIVRRAIEPRADLALPASLELLADYAALARRLASWSRRQGLPEPAAELEERATEAEQQACRVREQMLGVAV